MLGTIILASNFSVFVADVVITIDDLNLRLFIQVSANDTRHLSCSKSFVKKLKTCSQ